MLINLSTIIDSEGKLPVNGTLNLGVVTFCGASFDFSEVKVMGNVVNIGGSLELRVTATGEYTSSCARCLKPVLSSFDADIYENLNGDEVNSELVEIKNNECIIDEILLAGIVEQLPMAVLCSENCKGICSDCGKNLNEGQCSCIKDNWDSRFDILKEFKADL